MTATAPEIATEEKLATLRAELGRTGTSPRTLPSHPALEQLLAPGLRRGTVHSFDSTSLGIALIAGASASGSWCAAVGFEHFGAESAYSWGCDLERLALVPRVTGEQWLEAVSALIEGVEVVLACTPPPLPAGARSRLHARLRHRGATLLVAGPWPQAGSTLHVVADRWIGLGEGSGHLAGRELTVSHRRGHRTTTATVQLPVQPPMRTSRSIGQSPA